MKTQSAFAGKALTAAQLEETVDFFRTRLVGQPEVVEVPSRYYSGEGLSALWMKR